MSRLPGYQSNHLPEEARKILEQAASLDAGLSSLAESAPRLRQLCDAARQHRRTTERFLGGLAWERLLPCVVGTPCVLVVDDAEDTRELAAIALGAAGVSTITAANGLDALIAAHNARPVVILMDLNMPVLDGIEATRLLKAAPSTRHIHVIAHTGEPDFQNDRTTSLFARVLLKPALPNQVVDSVKAFMANPPPPC